MPDYTIFPLGDQAVTFSLGEEIDVEHHRKVMAMLHWLRHHRFEGMVDITVAYNSITVVYDLYHLRSDSKAESGFEYVREVLQEAYRQSDLQDIAFIRPKRVPVCYEDSFAPDMEYMMTEKKLSREQIIALHTGRNYQVYMIGFLPGFPYMAEVDPLLALPRKASPRRRVEAGSVGVAGVQTGIYPVASPGGWQIIGRTPLRMFDSGLNPPVMLEPGDQVEFYSITSDDFRRMNQHSS